MASSLTAIEDVMRCVDNGIDFVLQGGAGSGKTETLKTILKYITDEHPTKNVVCITHTNMAAEEISSRSGGGYSVSTIHSFISSLIKNFTKDMHSVVAELFMLRSVCDYTIAAGEPEYERYKKAYRKYSGLLYKINKAKVAKCPGKRLYDKDSCGYTECLNNDIGTLNKAILIKVESMPHRGVGYNETAFDNLDDLTFGHDGLLKIVCLLLERKTKLRKILCDKVDYLFIDEYQDTNSQIIDLFVKAFNDEPFKVLGLFGDSMQGIYEDGIGDVEAYVKKKALHEIVKPDNYRCSPQVIEFVNRFRCDGVTQEVALKRVNGVLEELSSRQGQVLLYYAIYDDKPNAWSSLEQKQHYFGALKRLVEHACEENPAKILMLTNNAISKEIGFEKLYKIFVDRFGPTANERMSSVLSTLQYEDVFFLLKLYELKKSSELITLVKGAGFSFDAVGSKRRLVELLRELFESEFSAEDAIAFALKYNLIKSSMARRFFFERRGKVSEQLEADKVYQQFRSFYVAGVRSFTAISAEMHELDQYDYDQYLKNIKVEEFYGQLVDGDISFKEVVSYYRYLNEETRYITMHKTKGTGIVDTVVVMEDFFWSRAYNFNGLFSSGDFKLLPEASRKILYVACSRTIRKLVCVRLISSEEKNNIGALFGECREVSL